MAMLQLSDGRRISNLEAIAQILTPLSVTLQRYTLNPSPLSMNLLDLDILDAHQKQQLLDLHQTDFAVPNWQGSDYPKGETASHRYTWRDLFVMHPGSPNLQTLIFNYSRYHLHTAPETMYVLAGAAIFGFIQPDHEQVQLLVQPGDLLQIAAGTEHWFCPAAPLHIKAIRYFTTADAWMPHYTGTEIKGSLQEQ